MSSTSRQNRLLLAEDWEKVYQSYRNAEFKSYDFDTIRRTLINYLRQNYPEDFNDYIESSEYLALVDMIAFLGQNIAYRIDLNARENFIELSERRESVLRLARLLSYNARRNQAANGILKIDAVTTTENIIDSNNLNLSGQTVTWNDPSNVNWYEQFIKVINSALPVNEKFGKPTKKDISKDEAEKILKEANKQTLSYNELEDTKETKKKFSKTSTKEKKPATKKAKSKPAVKKTKKVSKK